MTFKVPQNAWTVYADVLMLVVMTLFLELSLLLIIPQNLKPKDADYHPKAEYLVTMNYDDERDVDVDLWIQAPDDRVVYYGVREIENVSLDRDSRGKTTNETVLPDGRRINTGNREIISIRAVWPGDWLVAVHYYNGSHQSELPIEVTVTLEKVNPTVTTIDREKVVLKVIGMARNVMAFHIDEDGKVTVIETPTGNLVRAHGSTGGVVSDD